MEVVVCFNRNIVECKVAPAFFSVTYKDRFNRNIVECKAAEGYGGIYLGDGFNRNIVECKACNYEGVKVRYWF